jgi:hypothetical protein
MADSLDISDEEGNIKFFDEFDEDGKPVDIGQRYTDFDPNIGNIHNVNNEYVGSVERSGNGGDIHHQSVNNGTSSRDDSDSYNIYDPNTSRYVVTQTKSIYDPNVKQKKKKVVPTFVLKGVQCRTVFNNYMSGITASLTLDDVMAEHPVRVKKFTNFDDEKSHTLDGEVYQYKTSATKRLHYSLNQKQYIKVRSNTIVEQDRGDEEKMCKWCRRKFTHPYVGIPMRLTYDTRSGVSRYDVYGTFCIFECAYAYLKTKVEYGPTYRDGRFASSDCLLRALYNQCFPGKDLVASYDWELLDINLGPLSAEEYYSNASRYVGDSNIVFIPTKIVYKRR